MGKSSFAGSYSGTYLGDDSVLMEDTRLECGTCWYIYDPVLGDEDSVIPPGTPFSSLPEHWACPNCDGPKDEFVILDD